MINILTIKKKKNKSLIIKFIRNRKKADQEAKVIKTNKNKLKIIKFLQAKKKWQNYMNLNKGKKNSPTQQSI